MKNAIKFISSENGHYVIEVKEDARDWIEYRMKDIIERTLSRIEERKIEIVFQLVTTE